MSSERPLRFAKAHGLGNDFLLLEAGLAPHDAGALARRLCDRHRGAGADGLILYALADSGVTMRLLNADGSQAEMSGNGLRCLAAHCVARNALPPRLVVTTAVGPRSAAVEPLGAGRFRVAIDLGPPVLDSRSIPVRLDPPRAPVVDLALHAAGRDVSVTATSLGNPHCAVFMEEPAGDDLLRLLGAALENHPCFPNRTNVEFVTPLSRAELRVRFWERGVGMTQASGTGAASAAVAAVLRGVAERRVNVACDGGVLEVEWPEGGPVRQTGEVEILFQAEWLGAPVG